MKIKARDGTIREVGSNYILADGETLVVGGAMFMDSRSIIHDGNGGPVGCRPGFLVSDDEADNQAVEAAYREYALNVSERWRTGPGRQGPKQLEPQTFANPEAARAAAYAEYSRTIQERWRR